MSNNKRPAIGRPSIGAEPERGWGHKGLGVKLRRQRFAESRQIVRAQRLSDAISTPNDDLTQIFTYNQPIQLCGISWDFYVTWCLQKKTILVLGLTDTSRNLEIMKIKGF